MINFTSGHESRWRFRYRERFLYPDNHVEVDNRLSWFLGAIDRLYGHHARYVHLYRDPGETAESYAARWGHRRSIVSAFGLGISQCDDIEPIEAAHDLVATMTDNITGFLKDKPHKMEVRLENAKTDFAEFFSWIGAEGDINAALDTWDTRYNARS